MKDVLIDTTGMVDNYENGAQATGLDRVTYAYIRHFKSQALAFVAHREGTPGSLRKPTVLSKIASLKLFEMLLSFRRQDDAHDLDFLSEGACTEARNVELSKGRFFLKTELRGVEQTQFSYILRVLQVKPIFIVHDFTPVRHPELAAPPTFARYPIRINRVLDLAEGVITNSEATFRDWQTFAQKSGKCMPPTIVSHLAPGLEKNPHEVAPLPYPYFVAVGSVELRKNLLFLLATWKRLVEELGDKTPKLVIIGRPDPRYDLLTPVLETLVTLKPYLIKIEHCDDSQLATLLKHSKALLFPSLAEGYGLPLVEALALGVPVIANDLCVFREIAGDTPELIPISNPREWHRTLLDYASIDSPQRLAQLKRLKSFKPPLWSEHFSKVESFIKKLDEKLL